jgi:hypothetical protein
MHVYLVFDSTASIRVLCALSFEFINFQSCVASPPSFERRFQEDFCSSLSSILYVFAANFGPGCLLVIQASEVQNEQGLCVERVFAVRAQPRV